MRAVLLALSSATCLLGAADPIAVPVPAPPASLCQSRPARKIDAPAAALLAGYGSGGFAIRTANPEAQAYFSNGMQLAHAFAHEPAIAAFRRAVQLDPGCAMCVWGEAWSRGPTINYRIEAGKAVELAALADRAATLAVDHPPTERALIAALQKRYRDGGGDGAGDLAFAAAMDALARTAPDDDEIAVVAADAWMIPASHHDERKHLDRAVELLAGVLARHPDDSAAIHFYIHATEMNGVGADALPYVQRLQALAPAASHLVHMPSHTWFWTGHFREAKQANVDAVAIDRANTLGDQAGDDLFDLPYHGHNVQFGTAGALMEGDGAAALALAAPVLARLPRIKEGDAWPQVVLGSAYFAYGVHADRATMDALPDPGDRLPLARALWRYAHGEAAARRGDTTSLRRIAGELAGDARRLDGFGRFQPKAQALADVARDVLRGRLAMLDGRAGDAVAFYRKAATTQDDALDDIADPPIFWYPVRRSLAAALLSEGRHAEAAQEAKRVLVRWVGDPLSERILADVDVATGRPAQAQRWLDGTRVHWNGDVATVPLALL